MIGVYVGSTAGYSGKNLVALSIGIKFQREGLNVGYMKPVGTVPRRTGSKVGDEDAFFVQEVLGLDQDPELVTPVLVTRDFMVKAFTTGCFDLISDISKAYAKLSVDKDVMIVQGSGTYLGSGTYCRVEGSRVVKALGLKALLVDRYQNELHYDYVLRVQAASGDDLAGVIFNDVPEVYMEESKNLVKPFLERQGVHILGILPSDSLMGAITVSDLAERLNGKVISVPSKGDLLVENFLIGTMQVDNFLPHFKRCKNSAVIVGGDRSDVQIVALEGNSPCLILTDGLYPNEIITTRSEILEIPIIMVREDTYTVAKKMENILMSHKLRDIIKVNRGVQLVTNNVDFGLLNKRLGI